MAKKAQGNIVDQHIRFTIRQPTGIDLREIASKKRMNINELIRDALFEYVAKHELSAD